MKATIVRDLLRRLDKETVTLKRGVAAVACKASVRLFEPREVVGQIKQGDRQVIVANAEIAAAAWPGPPVRGDRCVTADGQVFTIEAVDTVRLHGVVAGHWLVVRGGSATV